MARIVHRLELTFRTKRLGLGFMWLAMLPTAIFGDYPKPVARVIFEVGYFLMGPRLVES